MGVPKQKTLFKKYLRITMAIVLASFLLLGMVMLVFVSQYWENEKRDLLRQNAQYMARMAEAPPFMTKASSAMTIPAWSF